jgi:hypothetical protein
MKEPGDGGQRAQRAGPERATNSDAEHGIVQEPPPDPRLIELTRIMARLAARAWYASQRRG